MAKTHTGSRHTAGKRRQRADIRDPEVRRMVRDGEISFSGKLKRVRETRSNYADYSRDATVKHYAEIETLLNYFNDEWFDSRGLQAYNKAKAPRKLLKTALVNKPFRCTECNREYHLYKEWTGEIRAEYLDKDVFCNIPLDNKECIACLEKQKNALPAEQ